MIASVAKFPVIEGGRRRRRPKRKPAAPAPVDLGGKLAILERERPVQYLLLVRTVDRLLAADCGPERAS